MNILVVNAGSSSLRLAIVNIAGKNAQTLAHLRSDKPSNEYANVFDEFIDKNTTHQFIAIAHRVVHGGQKFSKPCVINEQVMEEIARLNPLAPLHNPLALTLIKYTRKRFGDNCPAIAVFDTMFFHDLPEVTKTYAIPKQISQDYSIRRYGFHGLAHQSMFEQWRESNPDRHCEKVITLQLGSGCSICAINAGQVIDTSMGFSPMEGLMMATRCGDVDPGVILYLQQVAGLSVKDLDEKLNKASGLLGISGISANMRKLLHESHNENARLAIDMFCYRIQKYIGAYIAALGGLDAILFGGGIGENSAELRQRILKGLECFGIHQSQDDTKKELNKPYCIHALNSKVALWVVPVREELLIAQFASQMIKEKS